MRVVVMPGASSGGVSARPLMPGSSLMRSNRLYMNAARSRASVPTRNLSYRFRLIASAGAGGRAFEGACKRAFESPFSFGVRWSRANLPDFVSDGPGVAHDPHGRSPDVGIAVVKQHAQQVVMGGMGGSGVAGDGHVQRLHASLNMGAEGDGRMSRTDKGEEVSRPSRPSRHRFMPGHANTQAEAIRAAILLPSPLFDRRRHAGDCDPGSTCTNVGGKACLLH